MPGDDRGGRSLMPVHDSTVKRRTPKKAKSTSRRRATLEAPHVPTAKLANMKSRFFDVRHSEIQGRGAFASRKIRKGQRIIEYCGERISNEEADSRYDETSMRRHHTFLFTVTPSVVIDGAVDGNESIYINHSCDPNCEAVIEGGRIFIEAVRTIQPGEELAYDYQYERTGVDDEEMERFYKCRCGAPNCRGTIMKARPEPRGRKPGKRRAKR
jgi:SET domain-containing protein